MNKKLKYAIFSFLFLGLSANAQAMPKFGIVDTIQDIIKNVSAEAEKVQTQISGVLEQVNGGFFQNAMGEFNKMKAQVDSVKEQAAAVQGAVNDVQSAAGDLQNAANDAVNTASGAMGEATGALSDVANSDALQLASLQKEQAAAKQKCDMEVQDIETAQNEEIKKYEDNIETLRQMIEQDKENESNYNEQIQSAQKEIEAVKARYQSQIEEKKAACESESSALTDKIKELSEKAAGVDMDSLQGAAKDKAMSMVSGLMGGGSGGSAVQDAIIAQNFYAAGEADNATRNAEIVAYRQKVALEDTADVYFRAVEIMRQGDKYVDAVEKLRSSASGTETLTAGIMLDTQLKIEQMRMLLSYAQLMIAEMKVATAQDMLSLPKHLDNYEKNMAEFNLDDYDPKKKSGKKNKYDIDALKSKAGDAMGLIKGAL